MSKSGTKVIVGDVFEVSLDSGKAYFQYIGRDSAMLNAQTIRVFKARKDTQDSVDIPEIVNSDVDFHIHTMLQPGILDGYWKKIGHTKEVLSKDVSFKRSDDFGNPEVKISRMWRVWKFNSPSEFVGAIESDSARAADIGAVVPPKYVVQQIKTGKRAFSYPGF